MAAKEMSIPNSNEGNNMHTQKLMKKTFLIDDKTAE